LTTPKIAATLANTCKRSPLNTLYIIETKGREELDLPQKMNRLRQWCADATAASEAEGGPPYRFIYVDQEGFERNPPKDFAGLAASFREFQI
jgi:type III restriction enzyme